MEIFILIESLFYFCYYSYLKGDIESCQMYYDFLKDEFKKSGKKDSLTQIQLEDLKKIRTAINTGNVSHSIWLTDVQDSTLRSVQEPAQGIKEDEVVRKVHYDALNDLRLILGASEDFYLYNLEHPCDPYGRLDMLYQDEKTAYPVEVKRKEGTHSLIGQIMKYTLAIKLKLHYKHYETVQPVTICSGYDNFVLFELKKMGVVTLAYCINKGKLNLSLC